MTYREYDMQRDAGGVDEFRGFGCLDSCAGHVAGWQWAERNAISDPLDCDGESWAFIEGCAASALLHKEPSAIDERPEFSL